jgi:tetratricopeptide (TPR) repeat protein
MSDFFFISYSSVDGKDFARKLADELFAVPPAIPFWLDERDLRPGRPWDQQIVEAIRTCKGMIFIMSKDSVSDGSICNNEWARALKYKKPLIPLLRNRDIDVPLRLESHEYINFSGPFESPMARLREHLAWMDSPEGQLQALKYRLMDAERALPRAADAEQQAGLQDDIDELRRQIAQQQQDIDDPKAAAERVQKSIDAGLEAERKPAQLVDRISLAKFINPPPMVAPTYFQDRHFETQQIGEFLKDESLRLMTVVGRGGVGKTAMVCRLLRALESGQLPDDGGDLTVDGIVYLSATSSFGKTPFPDLYNSLIKLLPDETVKKIESVYKNPQATTRATIEAMVQAFPRGRTVVLLDNFEDMLAVETGKIRNAELAEALRALLELASHGLKIIITTRVASSDLALLRPGLQRRLDVDTGLEHPFAENILRAMDTDGKVHLRDASERLLGEARERTMGYPRALELLFGILSNDRDTSLQDILHNTQKYLPEEVVEVLAGEAFSRLDLTAQRVMQALAIYRYPVSSAAVDYLLQPYVAGIDSGRVLSRLVNMQFARRDAGRYYLHQVDRDYALSRIAEGAHSDRDADVPPLTRFALRHRAAEWFKLSRKPMEAWKTLDDLAAQLCEFDLRCEGGDYDIAAMVLFQIDFDCLILWGHYRLVSELHERLQGKVTDPSIVQDSAYNLGTAYFRMGQIQKAISSYQQILPLVKDKWGAAAVLNNLALCFNDLGQNALAIEFLEQALVINREEGYRRLEASNLVNLGYVHAHIGQNAQAVEYSEQALLIDRNIEGRAGREGEAEDLENLGNSYMNLGRYDEALRCLTEGLATARFVSHRLFEARLLVDIGNFYISQDNWDEAGRQLEHAIEIADDMGCVQFAKAARESLALVHVYRNELDKARDIVESYRQYDVPWRNHSTSAMLGVVALRQVDRNTARDAFTAAITEARQLIAQGADNYQAIDSVGLSLCGLVLCGDPSQIPVARAAYQAARALTSDAGIVRDVLQRFDALAQADTNGILAEVRPVAAGMKAD